MVIMHALNYTFHETNKQNGDYEEEIDGSIGSFTSQTYLRVPYIIARAEKRGGGKYVWGIWTGFYVHCCNVGSTNQMAASG